ncbi:nuclear transport factor 2 family protein [Mumia zhuanghuii]|uniref:Nuclear transport factor 2 family protein n=2 Tax=Mumia TaxID=1546255 RepID=A0ABW1QJJ4_9ACTN|nr:MULTISPECIES: nuclear transport factor 2 family protein [Mumia]KAA1419863.1 nuclear transport factor 2 family protein [Mumia zhuanghuii]
MTQSTATSYDTLLSDYLAFWNETDADLRATIAERTFAPGVTYVDPQAEVSGREALSELVGAVHQQLPGARFSPGDLVDGHHDVLRFTWNLGPEGAPDTIVGADVALLTPEGRMSHIVGFIDRAPRA